jgi:hypothetical protein
MTRTPSEQPEGPDDPDIAQDGMAPIIDNTGADDVGDDADDAEAPTG